jgi:hypothetical protein
MPKVKVEFDAPWKTVLDVYFQDFMAFCWPEKYNEIDWSKGYKTLDKELIKLARNVSIGNRVADKLIEVYLKNGEKQCILIHIEIHGRSEKNFGERMLVYRYRARDKYGKSIVSMAILIDDDPKWRPEYFREELWDTYIEIKFWVIKILDYKNRIEELEASGNPFAQVILAQLVALENKLPEDKLASKINLIRRLYRRQWKKKDILNFLDFIDWIITLPPPLEPQFREAVKVIEEERQMKYMNTFERLSFEEGVQKGEGTLLLCLLKDKFKTIPRQYRKQIKEAKLNDLKKWAKRILHKNQLEEIFVP